MSNDAERVTCTGCGRAVAVNSDGVFICVDCGNFGDARDMPRLEHHGASPWTKRDVRALLRSARRIANAVERIADALDRPQGIRLNVTTTPLPKDGDTMPTTNVLPPLTTDVDQLYTVVPTDASGNQVADTATYVSSDPTVWAFDPPAADTLSAVARKLKPGTAQVTIADPAGNTATQAVTVEAGGVITLVVTVTPVAPPPIGAARK